jgi:hypothetical protein
MIKELKRSEKMRKQGVCPHDGRECHRAVRCALSKADACAVNNAGLVERCSPTLCRKKFGACKWQCMRRADMV